MSFFFHFWVNTPPVLHPTEFFHCQYWKSIFLGILYFFRLKIEVKRNLYPANTVKKAQLWGDVARERRVKRRGFLLKGLIRTQITGIRAPHTIFLRIVEILRPEHALFSSEPPSIGGSFQYWQWKNSGGCRTGGVFTQKWKKKDISNCWVYRTSWICQNFSKSQS